MNRYLFVLNRVDDQSGGTLTAAMNVASALTAENHHVTLTSPVRQRLDHPAVEARVHDLDYRPFVATRVAQRFGASFRQLRWMHKNLRTYHYVHIHSVFYAGAIYTAALCRLKRVPYYVWPHGSLDPYDLAKHRRLKRTLGPLIFRRLLNGASALLCTSQREGAELSPFSASTERRVVPLPVTDRGFTHDGSRWRQQNSIDRDAFIVLFLGRIAPKKGLERLVHAVAEIDDTDMVLVIAGAAENDSDELTADVRRVSKELGVESRIIYTGWLSATDRDVVLAASNVFVLPSDNENFGLAVVEAMLSEVPVIISMNVYLSDELSPRRLVFTTSVAPGDIARAICKVRDDRVAAQLMARRARKFALATYSPRVVAKQFEVLEARTSPPWRRTTEGGKR